MVERIQESSPSTQADLQMKLSFNQCPPTCALSPSLKSMASGRAVEMAGLVAYSRGEEVQVGAAFAPGGCLHFLPNPPLMYPAHGSISQPFPGSVSPLLLTLAEEWCSGQSRQPQPVSPLLPVTVGTKQAEDDHRHLVSHPMNQEEGRAEL